MNRLIKKSFQVLEKKQQQIIEEQIIIKSGNVLYLFILYNSQNNCVDKLVISILIEFYGKNRPQYSIELLIYSNVWKTLIGCR